MSRAIHLNISIGESFIERFSGDGILVSTPAGSTAYNYSLGGSIVDPRLTLLQVTPIAPMNTTAYRSFTSSVILPPDLSIRINPEYSGEQGLLIVPDGMEYLQQGVEEIYLEFSNSVVKLLRFENYDFWSKVKSKFL
jgi:NAD+ kinase